MHALIPKDVRQLILQQSKRAHVGHIGSCLSVVELLCAVYTTGLRTSQRDHEDRDRFVLSKGHAALALYVVLHLKGLLSRKQLDSFCRDGTEVGVHPGHRLAGIDFSTGSLGMGLGFATGSALGARRQSIDRRVFALISDGECNEGSIWEAAMFASHHRLGNLTAFVDCNGQQAFGKTAEVMNADNLAERWRAFGWDVHELDGHDLPAITRCLDTLNYRADMPHLILARTVSGNGVSYMENEIKWHYWPMNEQEFAQAVDEVEAPQ